MATQNIAYATRSALTITLASLANNTYRESTEVSNTSNKYVDVTLAGKITTGTTPTTATAISIFAYAGDGTIRAGGVTGSDATWTPGGEEGQLKLIHTIIVDATSNHQYEFFVGGLAQHFGNVMPEKWGIVILNETGVALNATGGNHEVAFQGITYTVV
jgi:hypothetical protein